MKKKYLPLLFATLLANKGSSETFTTFQTGYNVDTGQLILTNPTTAYVELDQMFSVEQFPVSLSMGYAFKREILYTSFELGVSYSNKNKRINYLFDNSGGATNHDEIYFERKDPLAFISAKFGFSLNNTTACYFILGVTQEKYNVIWKGLDYATGRTVNYKWQKNGFVFEPGLGISGKINSNVSISGEVKFTQNSAINTLLPSVPGNFYYEGNVMDFKNRTAKFLVGLTYHFGGSADKPKAEDTPFANPAAVRSLGTHQNHAPSKAKGKTTAKRKAKDSISA